MSSLDVALLESAVPQTVCYVFESMLSTTPESIEPESTRSVELVTAALHFSGGWSGATLLQVPPELAMVLTGRMLGIDTPSSVDADVVDAMGELVNMVGGNLKTILPAGVGLSLPSVVVGSDYSIRICGGRLVKQWTFGGELGRFWVNVVEVDAPAN